MSRHKVGPILTGGRHNNQVDNKKSIITIVIFQKCEVLKEPVCLDKDKAVTREHFAFVKHHQFSSLDIPGAVVYSEMCSTETEQERSQRLI